MSSQFQPYKIALITPPLRIFSNRSAVFLKLAETLNFFYPAFIPTTRCLQNRRNIMASRKKLKVQNATANSFSSNPTENELNPTVQSKKWPTVPAPLMEMIFNFCYEHGFSKAGHHIRLETQRREKTSDYDQPCSWTNASLGFPSVVEMFNEWQSSHRDSLLMQEKSTARQLVGIKDKVDAISPSADSESDSESSWSSSSSSDSED